MMVLWRNVEELAQEVARTCSIDFSTFQDVLNVCESHSSARCEKEMERMERTWPKWVPGALPIYFWWGFNDEAWRNWPRKHLVKQFPFVPIRILYRHVQELVQGAPQAFSIDFNEDLIMELEGTYSGFIDFESTLTEKYKRIDQRSCKNIIHWALMMI